MERGVSDGERRWRKEMDEEVMYGFRRWRKEIERGDVERR